MNPDIKSDEIIHNIEYIKDREFNDKRYHIDTSNLNLLGWSEQLNFNTGLKSTIDWYINTGFKNNYWKLV